MIENSFLMFMELLKGWIIVAVIFITLERLFTLRRDQRILRKLWTMDLMYLALNGILIAIGLNVIVFGGLFLSSLVVPSALQEWVGSQPIWLQLPAAIVLSDLGFYAVHRLFHAVPWLWKFHMIHHSIEELDWLAAHRVHPVDQILTKGASLLPIFILGFSPATVAAYAFLYRWQSLLIHSNVKIGYGWLNWIVASPRFHHWHHANHRQAYDKNFAGQLSILDFIFGTSYMPVRDMPKRYGINHPIQPRYAAQLIFPFQSLPEADPAPARDDRVPTHPGT